MAVEARAVKAAGLSFLLVAGGCADAKTLDLPFVFSSNGDAFLFHDKTVKSGPIETEIPLHAFPSPEQLWQKYKAFKGITDDIAPVVAQDYFSDGSNRSPRYYQQIAINRTVEAIARNEGNNRHLLVMATGTGKTYTAFQIIYRLWKSGLKIRVFPGELLAEIPDVERLALEHEHGLIVQLAAARDRAGGGLA